MLNAVKKNYKAILVLLALLTIVFSSFDFITKSEADLITKITHLTDVSQDPNIIICDPPKGDCVETILIWVE